MLMRSLASIKTAGLSCPPSLKMGLWGLLKGFPDHLPLHSRSQAMDRSPGTGRGVSNKRCIVILGVLSGLLVLALVVSFAVFIPWVTSEVCQQGWKCVTHWHNESRALGNQLTHVQRTLLLLKECWEACDNHTSILEETMNNQMEKVQGLKTEIQEQEATVKKLKIEMQEQNMTIKEMKTELQKQDGTIKELKMELEKQDVTIKELKIELQEQMVKEKQLQDSIQELSWDFRKKLQQHENQNWGKSKANSGPTKTEATLLAFPFLLLFTLL
ncbi:uncharacterized protein LOC114806322 [Ornithorhynchus anatinus]|uniref:uncharacterized protein LOC114806322 n=1 Tax=Ornithorhynchus anatinus TaxID=9258 RepID=UPI0010A878A6|nr:uncharacterized protein LOC114806322 [Ornithorhynchus anatinus]